MPHLSEKDIARDWPSEAHVTIAKPLAPLEFPRG